ncbi:MAG: hypothetical protein WBI17_09060 [Clostridiaceae bacterium]
MNKQGKYFLLFLFVFIFTSGCSPETKTTEPKIGKYVLQGAETEDWAWVLLKEDHQFEFNRNLATSYVPMGTYKVENQTLILSSSLNEAYYFTIDGDELILQGNKLTAELLKDKSVFKLTKMD